MLCLIKNYISHFSVVMSSFWMENILEQVGIHLRIVKDKFFKILVCETQIHNFIYTVITSEMAVIAQEQNVTVVIDISIKNINYMFSRDQKRNSLLGITRKRTQDKLRNIFVLLGKLVLMLGVCAVLISSSLKKNVVELKKN